jgi:NADH-quinone oxidoreductase subunit L
VLEPLDHAQLALVLPLLGAILAAFLGRSAHVPVIATFAASAFYALLALLQVALVEGDTVFFYSDRVLWFEAGNFAGTYAIALDPLSAVMLATVTFVATWIAVFSVGYMKGDPGFARYFALIGLFVFAMCLLVLANNFMLLVAGWEGVGLCSYLLVGYYYAKPSAAAAARKAFLVTRLGDVGMILGIFLLWNAGGFHTDLDKLFAHIEKNPLSQQMMTTACLLLFCGAVGKSAQLPLYVWLPDAMEGPTPVSALIHAATMVTAGVYLLARCAPLFVLSPDAQITVSVVGGLTAFVAAFIAIGQNDLKRVLAYSTVSQLGFMFMALGCGGAIAPSLAVTAAIFHLFTHAFFKALLFLGSGSVMHAMGDVIDMRRFGGLRKLMPVTHLTFLAGAAALSGVPLLAGFWSKDQVLDTLYESAGGDARYRVGYWFVLALALVTAGMTAFYTFRAYFMTFWGEEKVPAEAGDHAHESGKVLLVPLVVLAVGAVGVGFIEPFTHSLTDFLGKSPVLVQANQAAGEVPGSVLEGVPHPHFNWTVAAVSTALSLLGIGLAAVVYGKRDARPAPGPITAVNRLSRDKLYVDEVYKGLIVVPAEVLATAARQLDAVLDLSARLLAAVPRFAAAALRPLHNGLVQFYALGAVLGLLVFVTVIVVRSLR